MLFLNLIAPPTPTPTPTPTPPPPRYSISIRADITCFDINAFVKKYGLFDVVLIDPPWVVTNQAKSPKRGVRLSYKEMCDTKLLDLDFEKFSKNGLLFLWCINGKISLGFRLLAQWGYRFFIKILKCNGT
jgi:hypothetical protein